MHHANIESSDRLRRVLGVLERRGKRGASSMDLVMMARVVAPGTCVSELRHQGYDIGCQRKGDVWTYRLA